MRTIQDDMTEFRAQLEKGSIQKAYGALISFMMGLRTHFSDNYEDYAVSSLYQGYLDMTYFALFPPSLKCRDLKVAIVFNYESFRFEAWLAARNRKIQRHYWDCFKDSHWAEYRIVAPASGIDAIVECDLAEKFDFTDPDALTAAIDAKTARFIADIEKFLSKQSPQ